MKYATDSLSFVIESSQFLHGYDRSLTVNTSLISGGLQITQSSSCLDFNIYIRDVVLSSNKPTGNLVIVAEESWNTTSSTHITIENTLIEKGLSQTGGGGKIKFYSDSRVPCSNSTRKTNTLRIKNSSFVENTAV